MMKCANCDNMRFGDPPPSTLCSECTQNKNIELIKIANRLGTGAHTQSYSDRNTVFITEIKHASLRSDEMPSKEAAEENLLKKLREIISPPTSTNDMPEEKPEHIRPENIVKKIIWVLQQKHKPRESELGYQNLITEIQDLTSHGRGYSTDIYLQFMDGK